MTTKQALFIAQKKKFSSKKSKWMENFREKINLWQVRTKIKQLKTDRAHPILKTLEKFYEKHKKRFLVWDDPGIFKIQGIEAYREVNTYNNVAPEKDGTVRAVCDGTGTWTFQANPTQIMNTKHLEIAKGLASPMNDSQPLLNMAHLQLMEDHKNICNQFHKLLGQIKNDISIGKIRFMNLQTAFELLYVIKNCPIKIRHIFLKSLNIYLSMHPFWNDLQEAVLGVQDKTADSYLRDLGLWSIFLYQSRKISAPSIAEVILNLSHENLHPKWVRRWIHYRARKGLYPSTLRRNFFGIQYFYKLNGYSSLNEYFLTKPMWNFIDRNHDGETNASEIPPEKDIRGFWTWGAAHKKERFRYASILSRWSTIQGHRPMEIQRLAWSYCTTGVAVRPKKTRTTITVAFWRQKNSRSKLRRETVTQWEIEDEHLCPVTTFRQILTEFPPKDWQLFSFKGTKKAAWFSRLFMQAWKAYAKEQFDLGKTHLKELHITFGMHRKLLVSMAYNLGVSPTVIAGITRHRSLKVLFEYYEARSRSTRGHRFNLALEQFTKNVKAHFSNKEIYTDSVWAKALQANTVYAESELWGVYANAF